MWVAPSLDSAAPVVPLVGAMHQTLIANHAAGISVPIASPLVLEGLRRLEYRGYDSAGIASVDNGSLLVRKDIGAIAEVDALQQLGLMPGTIAVGHTRWATHGSVTQANAHPHTDMAGRVVVVHNGIIENYEELRDGLHAEGIVFRSDTDSEVIPQLFARELGDGCATLEEAVRLVCPRLQGPYAFVVLSAHDGGTMIGVRKGNPLVVGFSDHGVFLSSDVLAFSEHARWMVSLTDGEMAIVTSSGVRFLNPDGVEVVKIPSMVDCVWADVGRDGYGHYMLKEILEQPSVVSRCGHGDNDLLVDAALAILGARQVVFTACGTSRHASLIGRYFFSKVARQFSDVVMASEFGYFAASLNSQTVVIAVSQSGETADVIAGVKLAKEAGARVVSVVNRPSCVLAEMGDYLVKLGCGAEIGVAATKTFTGQISLFYLLAHAMVNKLQLGRSNLEQAGILLHELLQGLGDGLEPLALRLRDREHLYYIGRGVNFAVAMEGALKMKEISYIHAEGMPAGELKHGTLALIEKGTPVVAICPNDETHAETISNAMEAKVRGAYVIGVSDVESRVFDHWIRMPAVSSLLYPIIAVAPLQLFAYHMALARGCDPDRPRNLAKSVTVK